MDSRHEGLDGVRAIACTMVVAIHVAAPAVTMGPDAIGWYPANALDGAARWAVPVFFMLTGWAYLLHKGPSPKAFVRLLTALVFYSGVAQLLVWGFKGTPPSLDFLWKEPAFYHLWYFYVALAVYGTLALVQLRLKIPNRLLWLLVASPLLLNPQLPELVDTTTGNLMQLGKGYGLYIVYAVLGGALAQAWPTTGLWRTPVAVIMFCLGVGWTIWATQQDSQAAGAFVNSHYGYGSLGPMLAAYGVFLAGLGNPRLPTTLVKLGTFVSNRSLAVYGLHPFVLAVIGSSLPLQNLTGTGLLLVWVSTVVGSLLLASLLQHLDKGRWVS